MRLLAIIGAATICMWVADFIFGAALALTGSPDRPRIGGILASFAYGLFGGS